MAGLFGWACMRTPEMVKAKVARKSKRNMTMP